MKTDEFDAELLPPDPILSAAKRERQAHSRMLVRTGQRTQESMLLISPDVCRKLIPSYPMVEFDTKDLP